MARLRPGSRLVAVAGGRKGAFVKTNADYSQPCSVQWDGSGDSSWVNWRDVALEVRPTPPPSIRTWCKACYQARRCAAARRIARRCVGGGGAEPQQAARCGV